MVLMTRVIFNNRVIVSPGVRSAGVRSASVTGKDQGNDSNEKITVMIIIYSATSARRQREKQSNENNEKNSR